MSSPSSTTSFPMWVPKPPKFSSCSTLSIYVEQLRDYFDLTSITADATRIAVFKAGLPAGEYRKYCSGITPPATFDEFVSSLISKHEPPASAVKLQATFHGVTQQVGETALLFLDRLRRLCLQAYPGLDEDAQETLVDGQFRRTLRLEKVRKVALLSPTRDLDKLAAEIAQHEEVYGDRAGMTAAITERAQSEVSALVERVEALAKEVRELRTSQPLRNRSLTCWNCGRQGHPARMCRALDAKCAKCGGRHLDKFCRQQIQASEFPETCSRVMSSARPSVAFLRFVSNVACNALIDTGASVCLISEDLWSRLGKPSLDTTDTTLQTADGSPLNVLGHVKLDFKLSSLVLSCEFLVSPRLSCDCILGTNFLKDNSCVVDVRKNVLLIGSEIIHLISQPPNCVSLVRATERTLIPAFSESVVRVCTQERMRDCDDL